MACTDRSPTAADSSTTDVAVAGGDVTAAARDLTAGGEICERCNAYCRDKTALWLHMKNAHGFLPYRQCPMPRCGRRFGAMSLIVDHLTHHEDAVDDGRRRVYTCELCGRPARTRDAFRLHVEHQHPDARAAMCGVCDLYMGDVSALLDHVRREHMATMASEPDGIGGPYRRPKRIVRCNVCGMRCPDQQALLRHVRVHGPVEKTHREYLQSYPSVRMMR